MSDLDRVIKLSEEYLVLLFNVSDIDIVKKHINATSLIGYDIFLKQTVFEIFNENFVNMCSDESSILDIYKRKIKQDNNIKSHEIAGDNEYKRLERTYKNFRQPVDEIAIKNNKLEEVQYRKLVTASEKMEGQKVKKFQENQLLDVYEFIIFKYIRDNTISRSNSIDDGKLIDALYDLDKIYAHINESYDNYFEKCIHYYQLEKNCRFETHYLIAAALGKVDRKLAEKKKDIFQFKCFYAITCGSNYITNNFTVGMEKYINEYVKNPDSLNSFPNEIYELNLIKYQIRKLVLKRLKSYNCKLNYIDGDYFFKEYLGQGQHIKNDKQWENIKLKDFRDLYRKYPPFCPKTNLP